MKKIIGWITLTLVLVTLVACGGKSKKEKLELGNRDRDGKGGAAKLSPDTSSNSTIESKVKQLVNGDIAVKLESDVLKYILASGNYIATELHYAIVSDSTNRALVSGSVTYKSDTDFDLNFSYEQGADDLKLDGNFEKSVSFPVTFEMKDATNEPVFSSVLVQAKVTIKKEKVKIDKGANKGKEVETYKGSMSLGPATSATGTDIMALFTKDNFKSEDNQMFFGTKSGSIDITGNLRKTSENELVVHYEYQDAKIHHSIVLIYKKK